MVAIVLATEVHIQLPVSCGLECIVSTVGEEVMHTLRMKAKLKQTRKTKCFTVFFNAKLYIILCKVEPWEIWQAFFCSHTLYHNDLSLE